VQASNAREANHANPSVVLWPLAVADEAMHQGLTLRNQRNIVERITTYAQEINYTLPYECLSSREVQEILETSLQHERTVVPEFFKSSLGEQELCKGFQQAVKDKKLCSVSATSVLEDKRWLDFFGATKLDLA
jgi:flagellar biosynthesis component FlhA